MGLSTLGPIYPNSISGDGLVVVGSGGIAGATNQRAVRWTVAGGTEDLGAPFGGTVAYTANASNHDGTVIVGHVFPSVDLAFRWTSAAGMTSLGVLPAGYASDARAINADGTVVVGFSTGPNGERAFRWTAVSGMQDLGVLSAATDSRALGVSGDGSLVVGMNDSIHDACSVKRAFVWSASLGMVDLSAYLTSSGINLSGWILQRANAISTNGRTIVGEGLHNGVVEAWVATIPAMPTVTGACCLGSMCVATSPSDCTRAGVFFSGIGVACNPSGANAIPCCRADFNHVNGLSIQDIFDFLTAWFTGDPIADFEWFDCGLNVQDIFAYLNAWFAGC